MSELRTDGLLIPPFDGLLATGGSASSVTPLAMARSRAVRYADNSIIRYADNGEVDYRLPSWLSVAQGDTYRGKEITSIVGNAADEHISLGIDDDDDLITRDFFYALRSCEDCTEDFAMTAGATQFSGRLGYWVNSHGTLTPTLYRGIEILRFYRTSSQLRLRLNSLVSGDFISSIEIDGTSYPAGAAVARASSTAGNGYYEWRLSNPPLPTFVNGQTYNISLHYTSVFKKWLTDDLTNVTFLPASTNPTNPGRAVWFFNNPSNAACASGLEIA